MPANLGTPADLEEAVAVARQALECAHATGQPIDCSLSTGQVWAIAADRLLAANQIEAVRTNLPRLMNDFPKLGFFDTLKEVFSQLPAERGVPFVDDHSQAVQVVPSPGADTVIFAFTGRAQRLMLEINLVNRWMAKLGAHVVYLRESMPTLYMRGVGSLAPDYPGTVSALRRLATDLGARSICCLGPCVGGYAALRYAIDLGAARVLTYSPMTFIPPKGVAAIASHLGMDQATLDSHMPLDLRPVFQAAKHKILAHIVFGLDNREDVMQAHNFQGLPNVTLEYLPGLRDHNSLCGSISARRLDAQLAWMVGQSVPA